MPGRRFVGEMENLVGAFIDNASFVPVRSAVPRLVPHPVPRDSPFVLFRSYIGGSPFRCSNELNERTTY